MTAAAPSGFRHFLDSILFSYSQILFCNRRWFGIVILASTFFRVELGALALAGVVISNLTAYALKFDRERIRSGFYGFNGVLFGIVYAYFFQPTPFLLSIFPVFVFITFLISAVLENYLATAFNLPGLSLPFMLSLYITILFLRNYDFTVYRESLFETVVQSQFLPQGIVDYLQALSLIFLQFTPWAGLLLAAGLLAFSRVSFVLSVAGFAANMLFFGWLLQHRADVYLILSGLNAILAAIALGGALVIPSRKSLLVALIAVLMVVISTGVFAQIAVRAGLPVLVLPFNFVVLATLYSLKFREKTSGLVLLYFPPGSPEENYYFHHTNRARFEKFKRFMADLPFHGKWYISQGHDGKVTHKDDWRYAWDFVSVDESGKTHTDSGGKLEDYYCYRLPVTAPLEGEVVTVVDSIPNNPVGEVNLARNWGNTIVIKHDENLYSSLSHLEPNSAKVKAGDSVKRGQPLALCGNSGRSPEPHLHFQFQRSSKIGDKTLDYPLGYLVADRDDRELLKTAEAPREGLLVQNLSLHRGLKEAFSFALGRDFEFEFTSGGTETVRERWEVKVDIYNKLYIESSAGAWVNIYANDRVFYLTGFRGRRQSALYYFYLCAAQAPLGYSGKLQWTDVFPLDKVLRAPVRYLSEFLLLFTPLFQAEANYRFREEIDGSSELAVQSFMNIRGRGFLAAFHRRGAGELVVAADGEIASFRFRWEGKPERSARRVVRESS